MRSRTVLAVVVAAMLIPTIAAAISDGSSAMADAESVESPADVDNLVLCLSGSGQTRLAVGPGDGVHSVAASVTWLIVADGTVTCSTDGGEPRTLTVSGAATLRETLTRGETHTVAWTMPDGSTATFNLRVGSSTVSWTEDGRETGGAWRSDGWLDDRDRSLVLMTAAAALLTCGLGIGYFMLRKSDSVGDVL